MIGALAVLITILAVFLAYNANNGLPFVKTYRLTAQVPDANGLVPGNEVRIGGVRVGVIEQISPVQTEDGSTNAALSLKLDTVVDPLPIDSTVIIRSRSALGLQYLQIDRGTSDEGYAEGAELPLSKARPGAGPVRRVAPDLRRADARRRSSRTSSSSATRSPAAGPT